MNSTSQTNDLLNSLAALPLFATVDPNLLQRVLPFCRRRKFNADQQVIAQGEVSTDVHFVIAGELRTRLYAANGREVTFRDVGLGEMFGELAAIDSRPRSTFVTALTDGEMVVMQAVGFLTLLGESELVATEVMAQLAKRIRFLSERVFEFTSYCVKDRVRAELLRIAHDCGRVLDESGHAVLIERLPTHAEIASRISTHREAVTREINALTRSGVLARTMDQTLIRDQIALQRLVGQDSMR